MVGDGQADWDPVPDRAGLSEIQFLEDLGLRDYLVRGGILDTHP